MKANESTKKTVRKTVATKLNLKIAVEGNDGLACQLKLTG